MEVLKSRAYSLIIRVDVKNPPFSQKIRTYSTKQKIDLGSVRSLFDQPSYEKTSTILNYQRFKQCEIFFLYPKDALLTEMFVFYQLKQYFVSDVFFFKADVTQIW